MISMSNQVAGREQQAFSRWTHGFAVLLTATAFPLIWVGGLVTTYGAGMAVPDWPNTYGWNMFLYPPSTWLFGGFDLLVEHGHRLLASLAGLIAIALWIVALRNDGRRWFRWWCGAVLMAVILQGLLGGVRVLLDERVVAMVHGCSAQLFLAMVTATAVMSSRWWVFGGTLSNPSGSAANPRKVPASRFLAVTASILLAMTYLQVVAGAQLRHVPTSARPELFMGLVHLHLTFAALVLLTSLAAVISAARTPGLWGGVKLPVFFILFTVVFQLGLGTSTWLMNYALPWQELNGALAGYTITAKGYWESVITTTHVATGALLVSLSALLAVRAWRSRAVWANGSPNLCTFGD
jgi:cytochrome c oxidase assembly protein subunit 15